MVLLEISCYNPQGSFQENIFGGEDIESCFDVLSELTRGGWQLISVRLSESSGCIWLPVKAFDGQSMHRSLELLQGEWESILRQR